MPLFRSYQPKERQAQDADTSVRRSVRSNERVASAAASSPAPTLAPTAPATPDTHEKNRPTRSRKEAEAERRARVRPNLSKKEARQKVTRERREARIKQLAERDATPEKKLLRDFFDARWNLMEFLLPALLIMLVGSMLASSMPAASTISLIAMYGFLLVAVLDFYLAWRRFKALLAVRYPRSSPKGLLFYAVNRAMQIRRMRMPPPEVKRGDKI